MSQQQRQQVRQTQANLVTKVTTDVNSPSAMIMPMTGPFKRGSSRTSQLSRKGYLALKILSLVRRVSGRFSWHSASTSFQQAFQKCRGWETENYICPDSFTASIQAANLTPPLGCRTQSGRQEGSRAPSACSFSCFQLSKEGHGHALPSLQH